MGLVSIMVFSLNMVLKKKYDMVLINISTYREERQLEILFSAIKTLIKKFRKNILLINIGSGTKCKSLVNLIKKIGVEKNVKLLSRIPNEDVIKLLKSSDIFIMTAKRVIFDISVLEALACGICTIVSNDGGNKEIIKDGFNGYLLNSMNPLEIAQKIISVDTDRVKTKAIDTAKQFSVPKMVDEYFDVYESLLDGI